jgi:hypothetical protein
MVRRNRQPGASITHWHDMESFQRAPAFHRLTSFIRIDSIGQAAACPMACSNQSPTTAKCFRIMG